MKSHAAMKSMKSTAARTADPTNAWSTYSVSSTGASGTSCTHVNNECEYATDMKRIFTTGEGQFVSRLLFLFSSSLSLSPSLSTMLKENDVILTIDH